MVKNRLRACLVEFKVNVNADGDVDRILDYKKQWDEFLGRMNSEASVTAHNAFHTSSSWVDAEAAKAIIGSTQETIAISAVCGWFGVLLFTLDVVLACLVGLLVLGIIIGLAFFMVAVMGWNIGAIEVIALVVFVGYSITYSLHIAHHYSTTPADDPSAMQLEEIAISRKLDAGAVSSTLASASRRYFNTDHVSKTAQVSGAKSVCLACGGHGCALCLDGGAAARPCEEGQADKVKESCLACGGLGCGVCASPTPQDASKADPTGVNFPRLSLIRTRAAVLHVGRATISSALSTAGSSFFLLFCTLMVFGKLGLVVIAVTILSIVFAIVVLPAALIVFGPSREPWCKRCATALSREVARTVRFPSETFRRHLPKKVLLSKENSFGSDACEDLDDM